MKKKIKNVIFLLIILLCSVMIVGARYYKEEYPEQDFSQILYYLLNGVEHTAPNVTNNILADCLAPVILMTAGLYFLAGKNIKSNLILKIRIRKKKAKIQLYPIKLISKHRILYSMLIYIVAVSIFIKGFGVDVYIQSMMQDSNLYAEYYVDRRDVEIKFPEQKRNLIIIFAESMETTVLSEENGGALDYSIVPELEQLALENTNFSNNEKIGGGYHTFGTGYSAGGIVAVTGGIHIASANVMKNNVYSGTGNYLPGAYTLGEVLREQGYNLEVMMGSDATFGGRAQYFQTNGDYKIFDVNYAIEQGKMKESDRVWWGFEDDKLFEWSKEEISNLASEAQPFNYIMITADTHFVDGYLSQKAENKFSTQYENVHAYSSKSIYEFVEWAKNQEFYNNTTIVIVGDHLGMQTEFYESKMEQGYQRRVYNVIINPAIEATNYKNREFTIIDYYPTILASMGVKIEGERLGIGTNLYSGVPTIVEELGYEYLNGELTKNSNFYNNNIFGEDYYITKDIHKEVENE